MELWYTEKHSPDCGITIKIKRPLLQIKTDFQQLDILESYGFGKVLLLDGLVMLTERDEFVYHEMISHVPMSAHPNPKNILIIGGGDGGTVREILKHPEVQSIDLVEIDRCVIDACLEHFPKVSFGLKDSKVNILVEDGIEFVKGKNDCYDIVIIDSTDPIGPAVGLFDPRFYQDIYKLLKKDGIIVTQSESPFYNIKMWSMIQNNLSGVFSEAFSYLAFIPTYPSGMWSFTLASKSVHPVKDLRSDYALELSKKTVYYNPSIHKSAFNLPNFIKSGLETLS